MTRVNAAEAKKQREGFTASTDDLDPRTSQTGGPNQPATQGAPLRRCNRILKDYLVQAASKQQQWGAPEFKTAYAQLQGSGRHADYIIARRLLRTFRALHRQHTPWLPQQLLDENYAQTKSGRAARSAYHHKLLEKLTDKWRRGPRWTEFFGADRVLGASLRTANSLYGFGLRFPERSASRQKAPESAHPFPPPATLTLQRMIRGNI